MLLEILKQQRYMKIICHLNPKTICVFCVVT